VLYCPNCGMVPVPEKDLPVLLPTDVKLTGEGGSPLAKLKSFLEVPCPQCPATARRETDTMDTFVESSWYFLRYCSPRDDSKMFDPKAVAYWMPVDQYVGGIEHAVLHLLYARFFTKVLRDLGYFSDSLKEPFENLLTQGMVIKDGSKMSKSKGNIVDPDALIEKYGADTVRLFCLFAAPPEKDLDWSDTAVEGGFRFLKRIWALVYESLQEGSLVEEGDPEEKRWLHRTIKRVTEDLDKFHFNTAIAALMEFYNFLHERKGKRSRASLNGLAQLLSPFAPHMTEELWQVLGHHELVSESAWPRHEASLVQTDRVTLIIQVNGVLRGRLQVRSGISEDEVKKLALAEAAVQKFAANKKLVKTIYVKDRLINLVLQ
ncbi:MAG: class I tRNA ligase family protein, partial [Deltaproteobacteria bacterium]|nr:class I tRNA ligase family protein [Deltaproteobacteria bacterium]